MAIASHIISRPASRGLIIATIMSLVASLIPMAPWQVSAAEFSSAAPAATVAPEQAGVPVLDFTLPAHVNQDRVLDADGSATQNTGTLSIQPGSQLFPIAASKKLYYGSGAGYEYVWIDRDMSKKYSDDTTLTDHDSQVFWGAGEAWHPDNGAPLTNVGAGFKIVSRLNTLDWSIPNFALFSDTGSVSGLVDPTDTRLDATGGGQQNKILQRSGTFNQDAIVAWTNSAACPTGVAIGDTLRVGNEGFFFVINMEYLQTSGGTCYAYFTQANNSYTYPLNTAVTVLTPYNGAIAITKLSAIPNQNTTQLTIAEGGGNLKGIAAGDQVAFKDAANNTISFRVEKINSAGTGSLTVTYLAGSLANSDNLTLTVTAGVLNAISTATFFDALAWQPVRLKYVDENGNGTWNTPEPFYWSKLDDAKPNEVSHLDYRVNGIVVETLLFKSGAIPNGQSDTTAQPDGTAVITGSMAAPKIYSQTADWTDGDDIVLDADGDGFYNRDLLTAIQVLNEGTAPRSAISKVKLYHNGVLVTELSDENIPGVWEAKNLSESLVNSGAFTVKADLTAGASGGTLKFAIIKESIKTTYAALPNARVQNANAQTVSTGAAVVPEAPPVVPVVPVAPAQPPAGASELVEGDIFMVAGAATGATLYSFENGKKNPYPGASIFLSWFPDFNSVSIKRIPETDVGALPWGFNARYRPGTRMIKIPDDPKVYAVTPGGKVCWVKDEDIAKKFYGTNWNKKIDDISASLFVGRTNYQHDPACDLTLDSRYPTGTLLRFQQKRYYVDGGTAREITSDGLTRNRFRDEFVIDVTNLTGYEIGAPVATAEFTRVMR